MPCYVVRIALSENTVFLKFYQENIAYSVYEALNPENIIAKELLYYPNGLKNGDNGLKSHGQILCCKLGKIQ